MTVVLGNFADPAQIARMDNSDRLIGRWLSNDLFRQLRFNVGEDQNSEHRIVDVLDGQMILLHGFIKKTQKTPKADFELAKRRLKEVEG